MQDTRPLLEAPDQIVNYVRDNPNTELSSRDLLVLKSRTFARPIRYLSSLKGPQEYDLEATVSDLYNILRFADEAEDGRFPVDEKITALRKLNYAIAEIARRDQTTGIDDLLENGISEAIATMRKGAVDEETRLFIDQFGKGIVFNGVQSCSFPVREHIRNCTTTMTTGMMEALIKNQLQTKADLEMYCDYVAGVVGETLTDIVKTVDGFQLDRKKAKILGRALQLTNITKNIRDDANANADYAGARTVFLPREWYPGLTLPELVLDSRKKGERATVFENLIQMAQETLPTAIEYVSSIPVELSGYKAFCASPLLIAVETWKRMRKAGPEKVFAGASEAVKISRPEYENISTFVERAVRTEGIDQWLGEYGTDPRIYSFANGGKETSFNRWSPRYLGAQ